MKAVCVLVCLALARGIAGSIFRQHRSHGDNIDVETSDYIAQYQGSTHQHQHQHQPQQDNHKKHKHQYSDSWSHESSQESKESKERINKDRKYGKPLHADNKYDEYTTVQKRYDEKQQKDMRPAYDDARQWQNQQKPSETENSETRVENNQDMEKIFADAQETMKHFNEEDKAKFHKTVLAAIQQDNEDVHLNATDLLKKNQYPVEEHTVKTDDGYYLTLFRIPPKKQTPDGQVVLLMHGLLGSADDWLLLGPGKSLAYILADAGHDVWLGNARGNKYSRRHASKHPALKDFWQFSNDEIALHDLPAMIDHALETSDKDKLHYIGHSQGNTVFFALAAERPSYNEKVITMHALAPMVYMTNARSPLIRMISPTNDFYERLHHKFGHGAFEPTKELIQTVGGSMCQKEIGCQNVCSNVNFVMSGVNVDGPQAEMIPVILGHLPAGTSTRVMKHYGQGVASHQFRKYDFGPWANNKVYGQPEPPMYEMEKVTVPVSLYYSEEDWLAHPQDVEKLEKELPNVKTSHKVPEQHFNSMDFQFSKKAPEVVYKQLIESMDSYPY